MCDARKSLFYARDINATISLDAYRVSFLKRLQSFLKPFLAGRVSSLLVLCDIMDHPEESKFGMTKRGTTLQRLCHKKKSKNHSVLHAF